jgi:hypothetical protein
MNMRFLVSLLLFSLVVAKPTVYLIRHGEKPANGDGLSVQGLQRAQCLRQVFSGGSQYQIKYIIAQKPKKGGSIHQYLLLHAYNPLLTITSVGKMEVVNDHTTL